MVVSARRKASSIAATNSTRAASSGSSALAAVQKRFSDGAMTPIVDQTGNIVDFAEVDCDRASGVTGVTGDPGAMSQKRLKGGTADGAPYQYNGTGFNVVVIPYAVLGTAEIDQYDSSKTSVTKQLHIQILENSTTMAEDWCWDYTGSENGYNDENDAKTPCWNSGVDPNNRSLPKACCPRDHVMNDPEFGYPDEELGYRFDDSTGDTTVPCACPDVSVTHAARYDGTETKTHPLHTDAKETTTSAEYCAGSIPGKHYSSRPCKGVCSHDDAVYWVGQNPVYVNHNEVLQYWGKTKCWRDSPGNTWLVGRKAERLAELCAEQVWKQKGDDAVGFIVQLRDGRCHWIGKEHEPVVDKIVCDVPQSGPTEYRYHIGVGMVRTTTTTTTTKTALAALAPAPAPAPVPATTTSSTTPAPSRAGAPPSKRPRVYLLALFFVGCALFGWEWG